MQKLKLFEIINKKLKPHFKKHYKLLKLTHIEFAPSQDAEAKKQTNAKINGFGLLFISINARL